MEQRVMRLCGVLMVTLAVLMLTGCGVEQVAYKRESLRGWEGVTVEGVAANEYLLQGWALVVPGRGRIEFIEGGRGIDSRAVVFADGDERGGGACVHVGEGYWLTAAHCVPVAAVQLVRLRPLEPVVMQARVVWRGRSDEQDIALLHTPAMGETVPSLVMGERPELHQRVLCLGGGLRSSAWSAGRIEAIEAGEDPNFVTIELSAPLGPGDSGGPSMRVDGTLAGINVRARSRTNEPGGRAWAIWVNPAWVRQIIARDRERARGANE